MNIDRRRIDLLMAKHGYFTYKDLATAAGLSPAHLSHILNRGSCTPRIAIRIANALHTLAPNLCPREKITAAPYSIPTLEELWAGHDTAPPKVPVQSIPSFLGQSIPQGWNGWPIEKRLTFWAHGLAPNSSTDLLVNRDRVCAAEIWVEAFGHPLKSLRYADTVQINRAISNVTGWHKTKGSIRFGPYGKQRGWVNVPNRCRK